MTFGTDIHVSLRMNHNNFGDPFTVHLQRSSPVSPILWFMTKHLKTNDSQLQLYFVFVLAFSSSTASQSH